MSMRRRETRTKRGSKTEQHLLAERGHAQQYGGVDEPDAPRRLPAVPAGAGFPRGINPVFDDEVDGK